MTPQERRQPELLASQPSRRRRIASGCGHTPADVDRVLADFQKMRGVMQQMTRGGMPGMPGMPGLPGMPGMGAPAAGGPGAGRRRGGAPRPPRPAKKRKGFADL